MPTWVDLTEHAAALNVHQSEEGRVLLLRPLSSKPIPDSVSDLGFERRGNFYVRADLRFTLASIQKHFPRAVQRDFSVKEIFYAPSPSELEQLNAEDPQRYPDGRTIPVPGDEVFDYRGGFGGSPVILKGKVEQRGDRLRVRLTGSHGMFNEKYSSPYESLGSEWTKSGEEHPYERRMRESKERLEQDEKAYQELREQVAEKIAQSKREGGVHLDDTLPPVGTRIEDIETGKAAVISSYADFGNGLEPFARFDGDEDSERALGNAEYRGRYRVLTEEPAPWQIPISRFIAQALQESDGQRGSRVTYAGIQYSSQEKNPEKAKKDVHKQLVSTAIAEKKGVPFHVLVDYPEVVYPLSQRAARNVSKLLAGLGIAERLMEGDDAHVTVKNSPYTDLIIERHASPDGWQLYLTHYLESNGDRFIDSEMVFSIKPSGRIDLVETAVQNPFRGGEMRGRDVSFANMFSKNLLEQGFHQAKAYWPDDEPVAENEETRQLDAAIAMVEEIAATVGGEMSPWVDSDPSIAGKWRYSNLTVSGEVIRLAVSQGGVVQVNGDPFTRDALELHITRERVMQSIQALIPRVVDQPESAIEFGKKAFEAGIHCAPVLDVGFMEWIKDFPGDTRQRLVDWIRGWTSANLEADLDPDVQNESVLSRYFNESGELYEARLQEYLKSSVLQPGQVLVYATNDDGVLVEERMINAESKAALTRTRNELNTAHGNYSIVTDGSGAREYFLAKGLSITSELPVKTPTWLIEKAHYDVAIDVSLSEPVLRFWPAAEFSKIEPAFAGNGQGSEFVARFIHRQSSTAFTVPFDELESWKDKGWIRETNNRPDFDPTSAEGYAKVMADERLQIDNQDILDNFFAERFVMIRNALRDAGWSSGDGLPRLEFKLDKTIGDTNFQIDTLYKQVGAGANVVAADWRIQYVQGYGDRARKGTIEILVDDLTRSPLDLAAQLNALAITPQALKAGRIETNTVENLFAQCEEALVEAAQQSKQKVIAVRSAYAKQFKDLIISMGLEPKERIQTEGDIVVYFDNDIANTFYVFARGNKSLDKHAIAYVKDSQNNELVKFTSEGNTPYAPLAMAVQWALAAAVKNEMSATAASSGSAQKTFAELRENALREPTAPMQLQSLIEKLIAAAGQVMKGEWVDRFTFNVAVPHNLQQLIDLMQKQLPTALEMRNALCIDDLSEQASIQGEQGDYGHLAQKQLDGIKEFQARFAKHSQPRIDDILALQPDNPQAAAVIGAYESALAAAEKQLDEFEGRHIEQQAAIEKARWEKFEPFVPSMISKPPAEKIGFTKSWKTHENGWFQVRNGTETVWSNGHIFDLRTPHYTSHEKYHSGRYLGMPIEKRPDVGRYISINATRKIEPVFVRRDIYDDHDAVLFDTGDGDVLVIDKLYYDYVVSRDPAVTFNIADDWKNDGFPNSIVHVRDEAGDLVAGIMPIRRHDTTTVKEILQNLEHYHPHKLKPVEDGSKEPALEFKSSQKAGDRPAATAQIRLAQIDGRWYEASSVMHNQGSYASRSSPLGQFGDGHKTRFEAIFEAGNQIVMEQRGIIAATDSQTTDKQKAAAREMEEWALQQILPPYKISNISSGHYINWKQAFVSEGDFQGLIGIGSSEADAIENLRERVHFYIRGGGWRPVGLNVNGLPVEEDALGVRCIVKNGERIAETITLNPVGPKISIEKRPAEFFTVDELREQADARIPRESTAAAVKAAPESRSAKERESLAFLDAINEEIAAENAAISDPDYRLKPVQKDRFVIRRINDELFEMRFKDPAEPFAMHIREVSPGVYVADRPIYGKRKGAASSARVSRCQAVAWAVRELEGFKTYRDYQRSMSEAEVRYYESDSESFRMLLGQPGDGVATIDLIRKRIEATQNDINTPIFMRSQLPTLPENLACNWIDDWTLEFSIEENGIVSRTQVRGLEGTVDDAGRNRNRAGAALGYAMAHIQDSMHWEITKASRPDNGEGLDELAKRYAEFMHAHMPTHQTGVVSSAHRQFAMAIVDKNIDYLLGWIARPRGNNDVSKKFFTQVTGVKLPKTARDITTTLYEWAGHSQAEAARIEQEKAERKNLALQEREAAYQKDYAIRRAESQSINHMGVIKTGKAFIDDVIAGGYDSLETRKRGAVDRYRLVNRAEGRLYEITGALVDYARIALNEHNNKFRLSIINASPVISTPTACRVVRQRSSASATHRKGHSSWCGIPSQHIKAVGFRHRLLPSAFLRRWLAHTHSRHP